MSYELLFASWKRKKSATWNLKVRVQIQKSQVKIPELQVQVTSCEFKSTSPKIIKPRKTQKKARGNS